MAGHRWIAAALGLLLCLGGGVARGAPTNFIGVNTHQPPLDVLDACQDLGVSWIRIDFNWHQIQPTAGKAPDFSQFDTLISEATKRGLKVFPTIGYGPAWASEPDSDGKPHNEAPKAGEYQKICQAAASHFKGTITHWGLWNEPNLDFFEGTQQQWIDRVVIEGIKGIKAGCPSCKVLGPELASVGDTYAAWLDASLKALKSQGLMYDIITWHIYSSFVELKPGWACWSGDLFVHDLDQHRVCFGIHGPLSVREVLVNNGLGNLEVWITETGYTAPVGDATQTANQVTYYRRVLEEQLKRSWWTHTFFYEIVDDNNINDKWGMAVRSGSSWPGSYQLKPVWAFVKKVLSNQPAFGGSVGDCDDGLDNDGDKLIDFPKDPQCASAADPTETAGTTPDAGAPADIGILDGPVMIPDSAPQGDGPAADRLPAPDWGAAGDTHVVVPPNGGEGDGCSCTLGLGGTASAPLLLAISLILLPFWIRRRR